MSKVVFFSIPAHGHTNPTIEVVRGLTSRGHEVWYYSFEEFRDKIKGAGANYISCDDYVPNLRPEDEKKVGKDFSAMIEMIVDTTVALDEKVCKELKEINPDCILSDSLCCWGKLFANKLGITYICSTTTFAFNQYTAPMMKQSFKEIMYMVLGMRKVNKKLELLRSHGYDVKNFVSIIQNDNETNTIVYTSKEFQPMVDNFSDKYYFVGPSVSDVIVSVGNNTEISQRGNIPKNFKVENKVNQLEVLQQVNGFISHCGMNSVNESLYYGVPLILFPQQSEQKMVCGRVAELGAGFVLKNDKPQNIKEAVFEVINNNRYEENAQKLSKSFKNSGGATKAVDAILRLIH